MFPPFPKMISAQVKRVDHDSLPDEIKAKFVENLLILQRMCELHLRLRSLSLDNVICPDSERYPFLKELIALDKKLHANWEAYDHYVVPELQDLSTKSLGSAKNVNKVSRINLILDHKATNKMLKLWAFITQVIERTYLADNHKKTLGEIGVGRYRFDCDLTELHSQQPCRESVYLYRSDNIQ